MNVFFSGNKGKESNGSLSDERLVHSLPGSPADRRPNFSHVIGSAESLVGRVCFILVNKLLFFESISIIFLIALIG